MNRSPWMYFAAGVISVYIYHRVVGVPTGVKSPAGGSFGA